MSTQHEQIAHSLLIELGIKNPTQRQFATALSFSEWASENALRKAENDALLWALELVQRKYDTYSKVIFDMPLGTFRQGKREAIDTYLYVIAEIRDRIRFLKTV